MATTSPTSSTNAAETEMDSWPIPEEQVSSGSPQASGALLWQSEDKRFPNSVWESTPGNFTWHYPRDETIFRREETFAITDQTGVTTSGSAGGSIFVSNGARSTLGVTDTVRTLFHTRSDRPVGL